MNNELLKTQIFTKNCHDKNDRLHCVTGSRFLFALVHHGASMQFVVIANSIFLDEGILFKETPTFVDGHVRFVLKSVFSNHSNREKLEEIFPELRNSSWDSIFYPVHPRTPCLEGHYYYQVKIAVPGFILGADFPEWAQSSTFLQCSIFRC